MTHLLVPTCCVEADVHGPITKQLLRDIFHNRSDAPTKPKLELGPLISTVVGEQTTSQVVMESPVRSPSRSRLDSVEEDTSTAIDAPFEQSYADPAPVNDDVCIARPAKQKDFDPNRRSGEVPRAELQALQLVQTIHGKYFSSEGGGRGFMDRALRGQVPEPRSAPEGLQPDETHPDDPRR